jgi:leukocyte elastase inhibitor
MTAYLEGKKMNRLFTALLVMVLISLIAALFAPVGEASSPSGSSSSDEGLVKGNNEFAVKLYGELASSKGNLFFSPYSISSALGMTYAGARGDTAQEMKETLDFQFDQARLGRAFKSLNKKLMATVGTGGQKLRIANGLCLTRGDVGEGYKAILKKDYDAELFSGGLAKINGWVNQKTEGKITKILGNLNPNSVCVILNAIYFKGIWESQFSKDHTREEPFTVSPVKRSTVPMMYQRNEFKLLRDNGFQAVSIPYKGNDLSMVILLPDAAEGLAGLEKQLTAVSLRRWLERLGKQPVRKIDLYLPKFNLETGYDLKPPFKKMGMKEAFGRGADFTGMGAPKGYLWISQIKHKAFVEVNEEGTEAAAATAVEMATKSMEHFPEFRADHPFLFLIRDNQRGTVLFMGRMVDPAGK